MTMALSNKYGFVFNFINQPVFISYSSAPVSLPAIFKGLGFTQPFKRFTKNIYDKIIDLIKYILICIVPGCIFFKRVRGKFYISHFLEREAAYFSNSSTVKETKLRLFSIS